MFHDFFFKQRVAIQNDRSLSGERYLRQIWDDNQQPTPPAPHDLEIREPPFHRNVTNVGCQTITKTQP